MLVPYVHVYPLALEYVPTLFLGRYDAPSTRGLALVSAPASCFPFPVVFVGTVSSGHVEDAAMDET